MPGLSTVPLGRGARAFRGVGSVCTGVCAMRLRNYANLTAGPVSWAHFGADGGVPLLFLHGTPGSRLKFSAVHEPGKRAGISVIAPDRWGYGGTPVPAGGARSLADFACHMGQLMDHLKVGRFAVAGVSGGGPYAMAVAAHLPTRVSALSLISPVGLVAEAMAAGEVSSFHQFCFGPLARAPRVVRAVFGAYRYGLRWAPGLACRITNARAPAVDVAIMSDCVTSQRLLDSFREGLRQGSAGPALDLALFRQLTRDMAMRVRAPTRVIIGTADTSVPVAAAVRLAKAIPGADVQILEGAGHLWVAQNYDAIVDWVASAAAGTVADNPQARGAR